jgi:hypothetical protein
MKAPKYISHAGIHTNTMTSSQKKCTLCEDSLPAGSTINICENCLKNADCCVGLEKLRD